jgi:hypothetical protein
MLFRSAPPGGRRPEPWWPTLDSRKSRGGAIVRFLFFPKPRWFPAGGGSFYNAVGGLPPSGVRGPLMPKKIVRSQAVAPIDAQTLQQKNACLGACLQHRIRNYVEQDFFDCCSEQCSYCREGLGRARLSLGPFSNENTPAQGLQIGGPRQWHGEAISQGH